MFAYIIHVFIHFQGSKQATLRLLARYAVVGCQYTVKHFQLIALEN